MAFGVALPVAAAVTRRGRVLAARYLPVLPVSFALLFVAQQASWHVVRDWWRSDPADWHGTYRSAIEGGPDAATRAAAGIQPGDDVTEYRVTNMKQVRVAHVSMPGGFAEVAETNIELLLGGGALVLLLGRRRRADALRDSPAAP